MAERSGAIALSTLTSYLRFMVSVLIMFFLVPFIIGNLGEEDYGLWALVFSILGLIELLDLGFATAVVKFVAECKGAQNPQQRNRIVSTLSIVYLLLASIAAVIIGFISFSFDWMFSVPEDSYAKAQLLLWILGGRLILFVLPFGIFRSVLFGEQRISELNIAQLIATIVYGVSAYIILVNGGTIVDLALVNLACMVLEYFMYIVLAWKLVEEFRISWALADWDILKNVFSFSSAQFLTNISGLILLRTDLILIKFYMSFAAVAIYAVALNITTQLHLLVKQFINVFISYIAELQGRGDREKIRWLLVTGTRVALVPAVILSISIYVYGYSAVHFWVGPNFDQAALLLYMLITAMLFGVPQMVASGILSMTGSHVFASRVTALSALANIVLSLVLLPYYGLIGVAMGTVLSRICIDLVITATRALKEFDIRLFYYIREGVLPTIYPGLAQFVFLFFVIEVMPPKHLLDIILHCSPGGILYLGVYIRFFIRKEEKTKALNKFAFLRHIIKS